MLGGFLLARSIHKRRLRQALLQLPAARRSDHTDEYFGHTVEDPYRWMEREWWGGGGVGWLLVSWLMP